MAQPIRPTPKDRPVSLPSKNHAPPSSRDKKILPGRRQQRHSTEIGCEYHRWWVVRNVLGFETNEHIAGLLLDGFHSMLQQLVIMCGGDVFDPDVHGLESVDGCTSGDAASCAGVSASAPPSASSVAASPFASSPPGYIEDLEEFVHYKSTIGYYCEYLWTLWVQQDRMQLILQNLSPPIQQFLIRLIGYIRTAKGKSQSTNQRRRRSRASSARQADNVDQPYGQELKSEYITPPQRNGEFLQNPNISDSFNRKDDTHRRYRGLNTHGGTRDGYQNWHPNLLSHRDGNEGVDRSNEGLVQEPPDGRSVGVNTSYHSDFRDGGKRKDRDDAHKDDLVHKRQPPRYWDPPPAPPAHQAFHSRGRTEQFQPWDSSDEKYSRAHGDGVGRVGHNHMSKVARQENPTFEKWKDRGYATGEDTKKDLCTSPLERDKEPDWLGYHGPMMCDKTLGMSTASAPASRQSSVPGTPRVYLDCDDDDQAIEADSSLELFKPLPGDQCLKSLLSRPVKVQSVNTPQFVNDDGTMWRGFQHSSKDSDKEGKFSLTQKCVGDPQLNPTDLSIGPDSKTYTDFGKTSQMCTANHKNYPGSATVSSQEYVGTGSKSTAPATLVYAGSGNGQPHPLGTPVFLYPAGGFPSTDNSLASLPALVQNIVYNQSGPPLLQPLAERPRTSSAASNAYSSAMTLMSRVPASVSGPAFMPLYVPGHPAMDTMYKPPKMVSSCAGGHPGNGSPFNSTSTGNTKPISDATPQTLAMPSSTRLYQDWANGPAPSADKEVVFNRSPQFTITDVRSCEDADLTHSHWKGGSNFIPAHKAWQHEDKMYRGQDKSAFPECQGLSGRKLNIFSDFKDSVAVIKNLNHAGNSNSSISNISKHTQAGHSSNSKHTQVGHGNNNKHTAASGKWDNKENATKAKSASSQALRPQRPTSLTRKRQSSSSGREELSDQSHCCETRLRTSSLDSSDTDSAKLSSDQDKPSQKLHSRAGSDDSNISTTEQEAKKVGTVSKSRAAAPPGWPNNRPSSRRHVCQSCELVFPSGTDLLLHRYEQHSLVCGECDSRFLSSSGLLRHKETDHPPISRCQHCRFATFSRDELASHIVSEHSGNVDEKSEDSEYLSDKLHKTTAHSVSSSRGNRIRNGNDKTDPVVDTSLDTPADYQRNLAQPNALSPLQQDKVTKTLLSSDVSSGPRQCSVSHASDGNNQDHMEHHDVDTAGSESEEPCLVIDTSDCGETDRREAEAVTSGHGERPLCLVVHTRDNEKVEDGQKELRPQEKCSDTNPFTVDERERKHALDKLLISTTDKHGKRYVSLQRHDGTWLSSGNTRKSRTATKRRAPSSTCRNGTDEDSSSSTARFSFGESSLEAVERDSWSAGELDGSGDRRTLHKPDHLSRKATSVSASANDNQSLQHLNGLTGQDGHRELTLRDRHTMSSLPPKKRGFRKSPRHSNANTSGGVRSLRAGKVQEKASENPQNKPKPSQGSKLNLQTEVEGKQNMSSSAALERGSKTREASIAAPSFSACHASKALKRKQTLSSKSHRRHPSRRKHRSSEAVVSRKTELGDKGEQATSTTSTALQGALPSAKVGVGSYKCPVSGCGASFSRKWTMEVHQDRVHMNGLQLVCHVPLCASKFSSRRELRQHVVEGHQGKVRRYTCSWSGCGKSFFARTHLRTHMLVHTGEKPVACQLCDYRCRQRTALIWHMRKHGIYGYHGEPVKDKNTKSEAT